MLSRRKFFSLLPLSALGLAAQVKAEPAPAKKSEEPSMWVEMTCQRIQRHYRPSSVTESQWNRLSPGLQRLIGEKVGETCGQRFKTLRVAITPICPKCGYAQDLSRPEIRQQFMGQSC
jgi:hypothetical protein